MTQLSNDMVPKGCRVLFIDLSYKFGGASVRALSLLSKLPGQTAALATVENSEVARQADILGINVHPVATSKLDPRLLIHLYRVIKQYGYTVLDTQNIQSKWWGSIAAWLTKTALVSTLNSYYRVEHSNNMKGRLYQRLETLTQRFTMYNIAVSSEIKDYLLDDGIKPEKIALIPNAIDPDLSHVKPDKTWLHSAFGIPAGHTICCAVGRLVEAKAFDFLIRCATLIKNKQIHYIIIGEGELRADLEEMISRLGLQDLVHLAGFMQREDTLKILSSSDFFVLSSRTEGTPIVLFEAAVLSIPIIATQVGGIPDIFVHNRHALLVRSDDESGLSKAITTFYDDPSFAKELADNAHNHVIKNYSLARQVEQSVKVYQKAIKEKQR